MADTSNSTPAPGTRNCRLDHNAIEAAIMDVSGMFAAADLVVDSFLDDMSPHDAKRPSAEAWGAVYAVMKALKRAVGDLEASFHGPVKSEAE